ncbi:MAG: signal recognition particle protein [Bdellovibrionaceae bacterium]|nr:signal recognition particle protein [Pseudobdellovibrionaceae bacterium]
MFQNLSDKILASLKKVRGGQKISEANIEEVIKEIRMSLLDADVNFKVVKKFIDEVKVKSLGQKVIENVNPGQMFVKIVHEELVRTLGSEAIELNLSGKPTVLFLVGLQGAGKTTSAAKLALYLRSKKEKKVGLVPADVYRPAAIDQLQTLGKQNNFPTFASTVNQTPQEILTAARKWADEQKLDVVIVDTAGRLTIDEQLMNELTDLKNIWAPQEILLVADAMLGQQSVQVAEGFHQRLSLTGLILTKMDGDARGGAALSIREVTGIPIKFMGIGEKVSALEVFHPDRLAGRILDMGDVLSLVERAQEVMDEKLAQKSTEKMLRNEFSLEDFLAQIQQMKKMGGLEAIMKFLPGMGELSKQIKNMSPPDDEVKKIESIIHSMTLQERRNHKILNGSRRQRIAKGSGTQVSDVNKLVKQFEEAQKMMSQFMKMGMGKGMMGKKLF